MEASDLLNCQPSCTQGSYNPPQKIYINSVISLINFYYCKEISERKHLKSRKVCICSCFEVFNSFLINQISLESMRNEYNTDGEGSLSLSCLRTKEREGATGVSQLQDTSLII